jgi:exonuclease SbcD
MQDFLDAFDHLVAYALEQGADAVIFAGDAYKSREPSQTQQREFAKRIRRLSDAGIATFLLAGNHDLPNAEGKANVFELYRTLGVPHVYVGDSTHFAACRKPIVMQTRSGPLQVAFLPWPQVSRWLAANPGQTQPMTIDQQMDAIEKQMGELVAEEAAAIDPDVPAVLAAHVSLDEFLDNPGSERWMTVGSSPIIMKSALYERSFDYIALGHHHNRRDMELNTPAFYAGSMQPVDFGEEGQRKGFILVDIDPAKAAGARITGCGPLKVDVPARKFITVHAKPKEPDPTPEICLAAERAPIAGAIVRVDVVLTEEQERRFVRPQLQKLLHDAHFVAGVRVTRPGEEARLRLPPNLAAEASSPLDALDLYFRTRQYDEARRAKLGLAAKDLMESAGVAGG